MDKQQLKQTIDDNITTNGQNEITGAKLNDVLNEMVDNLGVVNQISVGTTTTGAAGTNASVTNSGTATNPVFDFTIPRGANGRNGADAVSPFKGWYDAVITGEAGSKVITSETQNLPANPIVGNYAYVKTLSISGTAPSQTETPIVKIYSCATSGTWTDTGMEADTSNVQTFASGEEVNETYIDDTHLANPDSGALAKAEDITPFFDKMQPNCIEFSSLFGNTSEGEEIIPTQISDKYISESGIVTDNPTLGSSRIDCISVSEGDVIKMNFTLHKVGSSALTTIRFGFSNSVPQTSDQLSSSGYITVPSSSGTHEVSTNLVATQSGYLCVSYVYHVTGNYSYVSDVTYLSFKSTNKVYVFQNKVGSYIGNIATTLNDAYINENGQVTSYSTSGRLQLDRIRVNKGDKVYFRFKLDKVDNSEFITLRFAYFANLPKIGDNCIANTLGFVEVPLTKGEHFCEKVFDVPSDSFLGVSYYKYSSSSYTNISNASYHIVNYGEKYGNMLSLGDSITYGYIPHGLEGNPNGQIASYAKIASDILNINFTNYGISGNTLIGLQNLDTAMCNRYAEMEDNADIVTFMGGTNDIRVGVPLGTMNDRVVSGDSSTYTYYAGLHKLVEGLYRKYILNSGKVVKLVGITPPKMVDTPASSANGIATLYTNFDAWISAFKEVCAYYGVPVCDFYGCGLIASQLASTWRNTSYSHTGYFNPLLPDGVHPNAIGHQYLGQYLASFISKL